MRTITTEELKKNALEYYRMGKLTAQNSGKCVLRDRDGCRCAIGASLTEEEILVGQNGDTSTFSLTRRKLVDFEDREFAGNLQSKHDMWGMHVSNEEIKQEFLELLR